MAKIKTWLDKHPRIKAIVLWPYWRTLCVATVVLTFMLSLVLYVFTWLWDWKNAYLISDNVMKNLIALQAELRQFIMVFVSASFATGLMALGSFLVDDNKDGIPDKLQKGEDSNANQTKI